MTGFCTSANRSGSYARYYTFTTSAKSNVTVTLESSDADTYLYLLQDEGAYGRVLYENNNYSGTDSHIEEILDPGSYTVEATTYSSGVTGDFTLTITISEMDEPGTVTLLSLQPWLESGLRLPSPIPTAASAASRGDGRLPRTGCPAGQ